MTIPDLSEVPEHLQPLAVALRAIVDEYLGNDAARARAIEQANPFAIFVHEYYYERKYTEDEAITHLAGLISTIAKDTNP